MNLEQVLERRGVVDQPEAKVHRTLGEAVLSQEAIARRMGITRARVQQIELRALRKIRLEIQRRASLAGVSVFEWLET